jgi:serine/threonine protein kinase
VPNVKSNFSAGKSGKGAFGEVHEGVVEGVAGVDRVAIKTMKDNEAGAEFLKEASAMAKLKHDNIVRSI